MWAAIVGHIWAQLAAYEHSCHLSKLTRKAEWKHNNCHHESETAKVDDVHAHFYMLVINYAADPFSDIFCLIFKKILSLLSRCCTFIKLFINIIIEGICRSHLSNFLLLLPSSLRNRHFLPLLYLFVFLLLTGAAAVVLE